MFSMMKTNVCRSAPKIPRPIIGQGRAVAASVEGIARNPGAGGAIRTAMIIGLALIESLVIYSLVIAFLLYEL